jgi:hypothetical protein
VPKILRHRRVHHNDKKQRQKHKTRMSAALPPFSKNTKLSSSCENTGVFFFFFGFFGDWQLGDFSNLAIFYFTFSENEKQTHTQFVLFLGIFSRHFLK